VRHLTVVQCVPALDSGGVEQTTIDIASALVNAGHRSIVISAGGRMKARLVAEGSEHLDLAIGKKSLLSLRHIARLQAIFETQRPDIVHARSRLPAWLCALALRKMKTPAHFLTSMHGLHSPGFYSGVMLRGEKVICVSDTVRQYALKHWPNTMASRICVIEPGVDDTKFNRDIGIDQTWRQVFFQRYGLAPDEKILLLPGRGTRLKGHHAALQLLARLRQAGMNVRLLCVGVLQADREAYCQELRRYADALNLTDALTLIEPQSNMPQVYLLSDLVLQLSEKPEAYGRTVIEAVCMGQPVLGWDHGGVGENLRRYYPAGLVPVRDMETLFQKAMQQFEQAEQPMNYHGQTIADMQAQTLALYDELTR
jgi:glycosyltransferase involved in cell wall biosynthesis